MIHHGADHLLMSRDYSRHASMQSQCHARIPICWSCWLVPSPPHLTCLNHDLSFYSGHVLSLGGQACCWLLTQPIRIEANNAENMSPSQVVAVISSSMSLRTLSHFENEAIAQGSKDWSFEAPVTDTTLAPCTPCDQPARLLLRRVASMASKWKSCEQLPGCPSWCFGCWSAPAWWRFPSFSLQGIRVCF